MTFNCMGSLVRALRRFATARGGVSAVEFALLFPMMLTLYFGGVEVTTGVSISRKSTLVAHTVADLVAQTNNVTDAGMQDIFKAAGAVVAPYSETDLKVTVSSIEIDAAGIAKIKWSDTHGGTARPVDQVVTLKPALVVPNTSLIWGEVDYMYKPTFGWVLTGTFNLGDKSMLRPRLSNIVTRSAS
jgi:Flp pilus assembly protein TadG